MKTNNLKKDMYLSVLQIWRMSGWIDIKPYSFSRASSHLNQPIPARRSLRLYRSCPIRRGQTNFILLGSPNFLVCPFLVNLCDTYLPNPERSTNFILHWQFALFCQFIWYLFDVDRRASIMDAGTLKLRVVTQLLALDTRFQRRPWGYWVGC